MALNLKSACEAVEKHSGTMMKLTSVSMKQHSVFPGSRK